MRVVVGPLLPSPLVRPALLPVVPDVPGLRFQVLHTRDAAEAHRLALHRDVRGAFNVAADPVVTPQLLGELLDARVVPLPARAVRAAVGAAWRMRLVPASPFLLGLFLDLPLMDTGRARRELGWSATTSPQDALLEVLEGLRDGAGGPTPPLAEQSGGPARLREVATGVGGRGGVTDDGR